MIERRRFGAAFDQFNSRAPEPQKVVDAAKAPCVVAVITAEKAGEITVAERCQYATCLIHGKAPYGRTVKRGSP